MAFYNNMFMKYNDYEMNESLWKKYWCKFRRILRIVYVCMQLQFVYLDFLLFSSFMCVFKCFSASNNVFDVFDIIILQTKHL